MEGDGGVVQGSPPPHPHPHHSGGRWMAKSPDSFVESKATKKKEKKKDVHAWLNKPAVVG